MLYLQTIAIKGLRPFKEISRVVKNSIKVREEDPRKYVIFMDKIAEGGQGRVSKVKNLRNQDNLNLTNEFYVVKTTFDNDRANL